MAKRTEAEWELHEFPRENKLQAYVMKRLKNLAGVKPINISDRFNAGISDVLVCYDGKFIAIELKVGDNTPTALQLDFLNDIENAGGITGVAYNWRQVKEILSRAGYRWD